MTHKIGHTAMVLAAGFGTRMRPLTDTTPKPLIKVAGQPIIAYGFDRLREAGVSTAVVNAHYLPEQIFAWCKTQKNPEGSQRLLRQKEKRHQRCKKCG